MVVVPVTLLVFLLFAQASADRVPEVVQHLKSGQKSRAIALLKEIGTHEGNHEEAKSLVAFVRRSKYSRPPEIIEASFLALQGIKSRKVTRKVLALLDHSVLKKNPEIRIGVCRALEGSADPLGVKPLIKLMRDKEDRVIAAAARASGSYRYAKESIRKEMFNVVLGIYVSTWNLKNAVNPDRKKDRARAERKWFVIEAPMEKTLQLLSNTTQSDPPAWRRWWNKNKRDRWASLDN